VRELNMFASSLRIIVKLGAIYNDVGLLTCAFFSIPKCDQSGLFKARGEALRKSRNGLG
jgi:hypothetical protein